MGCFKFNCCREQHTTAYPHANVRKMLRGNLKIIFDGVNNKIQPNIVLTLTVFQKQFFLLNMKIVCDDTISFYGSVEFTIEIFIPGTFTQHVLTNRIAVK